MLVKLLLVSTISLGVVAICAPSGLAAEIFSGTVISVTDGDTFIVAHNGRPEKIRLLNIDSPEKGQPFGKAAKKALSDLIYMQSVSVNSTGKDRYGRTLAVVTTENGINTNEQLVSTGFAWVYRARTKDRKLLAMEQDARDNKRGLWSQKDAQAPWDYRKLERTTRSKRYAPNVSSTEGLIRQLVQERPASKTSKK